MTLEDLGLSPIFIVNVRAASGDLLADRKVVLAGGFVYVETTLNGQTAVTAYPAVAVKLIEDLRPGPSTSYVHGA